MRFVREFTPEQLARKVAYLTKARTAEKVAHKFEVGTRVSNRIGDIWLVRTMLATPTVTTGMFEAFCKEFPGVEMAKAISKTSIGKVRDAMAEIVKSENSANVKQLFSAFTALQPGQVARAYVPHQQDEAYMRIRSSDPLVSKNETGMVFPNHTPMTSRARGSKIQNHVLDICFGTTRQPWYSELQAMRKKDAGTLATCLITAACGPFECLVSAVADGNGPPDGASCKVKVFHLITGDAIGTNDAAMRKVMYYFLKMWPLRTYMIYHLIGFKCAAHKANLVTVAAICGRMMRKPIQGNRICGAAVRYFKYLVPSYSDDFALRLKDLVMRRARCVPRARGGDGPLPVARTDAALRSLYGDEVYPPILCDLFYKDMSLWEMDGTPEEEPAMKGYAFQLLHQQTLREEHHPVVTRFFLFASCTFMLLRIKVLGVPVEVFNTSSATLRTSAKRLTRFHDFYSSAEGDRDLRSACLCLRLTLFAVSLSSKKAAADEVPTLVLLGQKNVQRRTKALLCELVPQLSADPALDLDQAVPALLVTEGHIFLRYDEYCEFPTELWRLTRRWNPHGYCQACEKFLGANPDSLDAGYSWPLQAQALAADTYAEALAYLLKFETQGEIVDIIARLSATSLDVERKHHTDKVTEKKTKKSMSVARASRNSILQAFRVWRLRHLTEQQRRRRECDKIKKTNVWSLARQAMPHLVKRPRGRLLNEKNDVSAAEASSVVHAGDPKALAEFVQENRPMLEAQLPAASANTTMGNTSPPTSNAEWLKWVGDNRETVQKRMATATAERRSAYSTRVVPIPGLLSAERIQPVLPKSPPWARKIQVCDKGPFYAVVCGDGRRVYFFAVAIGPKCWAFPLRSPEILADNEFVIDVDTCWDSYGPIQELQIPDDVEPLVYALVIHVDSIIATRVAITAIDFDEVTDPPRRKARKAGAEEEDSSEGPEEGLSSDEDSDIVTVASQEESGAGSETAESVAGADQSDDDNALEGGGERAAKGTYTIWTSGYFRLSRSPHYKGAHQGITMTMRPKWATETELGAAKCNKTLVIAQYDDEPDASPAVGTMLALRAWMLWRAQSNDWHTRNAVRHDWFKAEVRSLQDECAGAHLRDTARLAIEEWLPGILS